MEEKEDILAQVGLGAMILFVGSLIAIISCASVMILQLEIISEKTEAVVATTSKLEHTQVCPKQRTPPAQILPLLIYLALYQSQRYPLSFLMRPVKSFSFDSWLLSSSIFASQIYH